MRATDLTCFWFWPERQRRPFDAEEWQPYVDAAAEAGVRLELVTVDDIDLVLTDPPVAHVRGRPVDPARAFFHNKLYTWPELAADVWRSLALYEALSAAGYMTMIPMKWNVIANDKVATLLEMGHLEGVRRLHSVAIPTRDIDDLPVDFASVGVGYPAIAKPVHWAGGRGVIRVDDHAELLMALKLASAAELTMLVEPLVAPHTDLYDIRVLCIDGEPDVAILRQVGANATVANAAGGGRSTVCDVPSDLEFVARRVAQHVGLPWVGIDFLRACGQPAWLSEIEVDAYMAPAWMTDARMADAAQRRFAAYRTRFEHWRSEL